MAHCVHARLSHPWQERKSSEVLFTDPLTGASTIHEALKIDRGVSWAEAGGAPSLSFACPHLVPSLEVASLALVEHCVQHRSNHSQALLEAHENGVAKEQLGSVQGSSGFYK